MTPYVQCVLDRYRRLPQTLGQIRPSDRQLAAELERRGVPLPLVEAALCLAALRRILRPASAPPQGAILKSTKGAILESGEVEARGVLVVPIPRDVAIVTPGKR